MLSGILSPVFLQAAGRAGKGGHVGKITLFTQNANPTINSISCTGEIKVSSIYNGEKKVETYSDLNSDTLSIQADANTQIVISGTDITYFDINSSINYTKISVKNTAITQLVCNDCYALTTIDVSNNTALTMLSCNGCYALTTIDVSNNTALTEFECSDDYTLTTINVSKNTALTMLNCGSCYTLNTIDVSNNTAITELNCGSCYTLNTIDVSKNTALTMLSCSDCSGLTTLNLSKNTALETLACGGCTKLVSIYYPATNSDVSTDIASAITAATSTTGTVYTDSAAAYYSTISTAATTKGWTIAPIPA